MESQLGAAGVDVGAKVEISTDEIANVATAFDADESAKVAELIETKVSKNNDLSGADVSEAEK